MRKMKTRQLPSRRAKEAMEVTPSVESMVDTGGRTVDRIHKTPSMIHQHYMLITPETKEVKVEAEAFKEDSKAEDLVEDSKEEDLKVEAADRLKNNITNTIPILQKQMLAQ